MYHLQILYLWPCLLHLTPMVMYLALCAFHAALNAPSECSLTAEIFVFLIFLLSTFQCLMLLSSPCPSWITSLILMALLIPSSKLQMSAINCLLTSQNQHVTTPTFIIMAKLASPLYSPSRLMSLTFTHLYTLEIWRHLWLFPHIALAIQVYPFYFLSVSGID